MFTYSSIFRYFSVQQNSPYSLFFCMLLDWKILIGSKNNHLHYITLNIIGSFVIWSAGYNKFFK